MRIVAGEFRSRVIKAVDGDTTRPTTDKIKEAIFSRIGPYFDGGTMLDLFGGSGNMGLEALSRGMDAVVFCDKQEKAIRTIRENANALQVLDRCQIVKADYMTLLQRLAQAGAQFDLIYLDPPYRKQQIHTILTFIAEHELLKDHGNVIAESQKEDEFEAAYGALQKVKDVTYGITRITYYKR